MIEAKRIAHVMGLTTRIDTLHDLAEMVTKGLPKGTIRTVVSHVLPRRAEQTAFIHEIIPEATYKRRSKTLSAAESARTERLARVVATSEYVWDEPEDASRFLTTPHAALNGNCPVDVAKTELGAREVEELLWKLFHGLPL